jgi:hypothetical protein
MTLLYIADLSWTNVKKMNHSITVHGKQTNIILTLCENHSGGLLFSPNGKNLRGFVNSFK